MEARSTIQATEWERQCYITLRTKIADMKCLCMDNINERNTEFIMKMGSLLHTFGIYVKSLKDEIEGQRNQQ